MKKIVLATTLSLSLAAPAVAETLTGTITDHFKVVISQTPYTVEVCRDVTVSGDKTGDTLKGAIIGGIIGNNVGDVKNGGALGAILGGAIGHNNSKATGGTKRVCSIETRYNEEQREVYSHSTMRFASEGKQHTIKFYK
mgnify:CR=1 FL=1